MLMLVVIAPGHGHVAREGGNTGVGRWHMHVREFSPLLSAGERPCPSVIFRNKIKMEPECQLPRARPCSVWPEMYMRVTDFFGYIPK